MIKKKSSHFEKKKKGEGIKVKLPQGSFTSLLFLPIWEEKFLWTQGENFLPSFPLPLFSPHYQTVENSSFPFYIFHLPIIYPTKHNVRERDEWEERICNGIISRLRIGTKMVCF